MDDELTNARIPLVPPVARALEERHGELVQGRTTRRSGKPNRPQIVNRDLARYYDLLHLAVQRIGPRFSEDDKLTILHALIGTHTDPWAVGSLADEVRDSVEDGSHDALAARLAALTPTEEIAVIDAVERHKIHGMAAVPVF